MWWFSERLLLEPLGYLPPDENEDAFYRCQEAWATEAALAKHRLRRTWGGSLHEQAHVYQGHLQVLGDRGLPLHWAELGAAEPEAGSPAPAGQRGLPPRTAQALELQADAFAAHILLDRFFDRGATDVFPDNPLVRDGPDWVRFAFLAMTTVFAILERADRALHADPEQRAHPSARVRLLGAFAVLRWVLVQKMPDEGARAALVQTLLEDSARIFALVGVSPLDADAFAQYVARATTPPRHPVARTLVDLQAELSHLKDDLAACSRRARDAYGL